MNIAGLVLLHQGQEKMPNKSCFPRVLRTVDQGSLVSQQLLLGVNDIVPIKLLATLCGSWQVRRRNTKIS